MDQTGLGGDRSSAHCRRTHAQAQGGAGRRGARVGRVATGGEPVGAAVGRGQWRLGKLKAKTLGRPKRLNAQQCESLSRMLVAGALQAGFPTELWTVKRVRALVAREFGVEYSNSGGWELLRSLGFSPQKPEKRATQRDEQAIVQWKRKTWPALKKKRRRERRTIVFIDESGLSEKCPVTRTWAPKGHTPIIQQSFTWKQMSAVAGLSWWRFYFRFFDGAIKSEQIIEFLERAQAPDPQAAADHLGRRGHAQEPASCGNGSKSSTGASPSRSCRPTRLSSIRSRRSGPISRSMRSPTCA